jgi:hypothetical protein
MSINNPRQSEKRKPGPTRQYSLTEIHALSSDHRLDSVQPVQKASIVVISPRSESLIWEALLRADQKMTQRWPLRTLATDEQNQKPRMPTTKTEI